MDKTAPRCEATAERHTEMQDHHCTLQNPKRVGRYGNILVVLSPKNAHLFEFGSPPPSLPNKLHVYFRPSTCSSHDLLPLPHAPYSVERCPDLRNVSRFAFCAVLNLCLGLTNPSRESEAEFPRQVAACVRLWEADECISAVWINVHASLARYIPALLNVGFELHRVVENRQFIALCKWLLPSESKIPEAGTHIGGACGMIVRRAEGEDDYEVLCIRERHRREWWEFPGGAVERGEYFVDVAVREVAEEVGLKVHPVGFVGIWDELASRYNCNSTYCCVLMELDEGHDGDAMVLQDDEILEARWASIADIMRQSEAAAVGSEFPVVGDIPLSAPAFMFIQDSFPE